MPLGSISKASPSDALSAVDEGFAPMWLLPGVDACDETDEMCPRMAMSMVAILSLT